ncbi:hypothetical protein SK128_007635 [Halocaridina rubra]|uniref:Secreted protein n=1 Tax=Halocaridina rubra TaxID=373956 RepID=A0AAN9A645_HALRR
MLRYCWNVWMSSFVLTMWHISHANMLCVRTCGNILEVHRLPIFYSKSLIKLFLASGVAAYSSRRKDLPLLSRNLVKVAV